MLKGDIVLHIDYRERELIKKLKQSEDDINTACVGDIKLTYKVSNLPIGDLLFVVNQEHQVNSLETDIVMEQVLLAIERKTVKDLSASITDGRFREQKARLLDSIQDNAKIVYLIEGSKRSLVQNNTKTQKMIDGSIINLLFRHQYKVLFTESEQDTINMLSLLYKKLSDDDFISFRDKSNDMKSLLSKKDKIKNNMCAMQLSVIPGVSYKTAETIASIYPTLNVLVEAFNSTDTPETLLENILLNNKRKLGKALASKIFNALCHV
jgi:ERCC4-type nuclease